MNEIAITCTCGNEVTNKINNIAGKVGHKFKIDSKISLLENDEPTLQLLKTTVKEMKFCCERCWKVTVPYPKIDRRQVLIETLFPGAK